MMDPETANPTPFSNETETKLELAEEEHTDDALTAVLINVTLIGCLMLAYYVRRFRIYYLPESAGALLVGVVVGGIARLCTDNLVLFEFSPELFFFILLPVIIFEAGYSLQRKDFFENIGAITLYAMLGTIISTFCVGGLTFWVAKMGILRDVDDQNPMEAMLFGALISAVDPVATLSIMGNADLGCDPLLYSLVFGESVLNDAVAISLFRVFSQYYSSGSLSASEIPSALVQFAVVSLCSVLTGVALGLVASFLYKHTKLSDYPHLETSLLFCFCYLCYATSEAVGWSGIMSLFFQGMVLSHYNSYNLSPTAHVASEQIFSCLATISETMVFLYMGMSCFTGKFSKYDLLFSILALAFCILGRCLNIFPLSWLANLVRRSPNVLSEWHMTNGSSSEHSHSSNASNTASGSRRITMSMQFVLWFAGLRGAIAFALAMNMPGPNSEVYATATLFICIFTTVVCGGLTAPTLEYFGMKRSPAVMDDSENGGGDGQEELRLNRLSYNPYARPEQQAANMSRFPLARRTGRHVYKGAKRLWKQFDDEVLKVWFGGSAVRHRSPHNRDDELGNYELSCREASSNSDDSDDDDLSLNDDGQFEQDEFVNSKKSPR